MRQKFFCIATSDFTGETTRVDNHKRNSPIIKGHIWILWKLTMILKIIEFCWQTVQRAACSSKTTFLCIKFQNSVLYFYGAKLNNHSNIMKRKFVWIFMDHICPDLTPSQFQYWASLNPSLISLLIQNYDHDTFYTWPSKSKSGLRLGKSNPSLI